MKKILQLSTYPILKPLHGGQIRVSKIREFFEKKACIVKSISLSEMSHMFYSKDDFLLSAEELNMLTDTPFSTDFATSQISSKGKAFEFIKKHVISLEPDIIFLEQVWLWNAVKKLKKQNFISSDVKIIYSSQNVEYKTKRALFDSHNIKADKIIAQIFEMEKELVQFADTVVACTQDDIEEFKQIGAKDTMLCNNGVSIAKIDKKISDKLMDDLAGRKYILFVGSAYPPNALGFWEMVGNSLAWLPPEYIVLSVGGVSKILQDYQKQDSAIFDYVSLDRLKRVGFVSEKLLSSLLYNATVIILPITVGGGSNLKTAEAIASLRPVVATSKACRGFDFTDKLSNFKIRDDRASFIEAIQGFLGKKVDLSLLESEKRLRMTVNWENTLEPLKKFI